MSFLVLDREGVIWLVSLVTPSNDIYEYAIQILLGGREVAREWPNPPEAA